MSEQLDNPNNNSMRTTINQPYSSLPHTYTVRQMKEYILTEAELDDIGLLNTLSSGFFSAASGSFLFAVGLWASAIVEDSLSEKAIALIQFGEWTGLILAILFALIGCWAWFKRRSKLVDIKRKSTAIDQIGLIPSSSLTQSMISTADTEDSQTE